MTEPSYERSRPERVTTGVPRLDTLLHGGLIRGGLYVVQGPPGSGKTVLANQCCYHHVETDGKQAIYITLLAETTGKMMAFLEALDFAKPSRVANQVHYFAGYPTLNDKGVAGLLALLKRVVPDHKASFLVVDGIDNVAAVATSLVAYREFIHALQTFVSLAQCTTLLLTPSLPSARAAGPELAVSDGVIELGKQQFGPRTIREIQIHKFRGGGVLEGRHEIDISHDGVVVHPRTEVQFAAPLNLDRGENRVRMAFGVKGLDAMLHGGVFSGSMSTLYGAPGTGKTSLGLSFLTEGATRGEHGIYLGFYETPSRLLCKAETLGLKMEHFVETGLLELQWQQAVENIPDAIAERLLDRIRAKGRLRVRVFIDGMSGFRRAMPYPERFAPFLTALTNELRTIGATTVYSEEAPLFNSSITHPDSELGSIVDNVIFLRYMEHREKILRQMMIMKARESDFDASIREYAITSRGVVLTRSAKPLSAKTARPVKRRAAGGTSKTKKRV